MSATKSTIKTNAFTAKGKARSRYGMKVLFNDGNKFYYRGDDNLVELQKQQYKNITELEGLIITFKKLRDRIGEAYLFDNAKSRGQDLLMHYAIGKVLQNNLPNPLQNFVV